MADAAATNSLESLAFKYGTDKSHDDHKYTDLYTSLLEPRRMSTRAMLEVGVAAGQSVAMWHDYFPRATVHGLDIHYKSGVQGWLANFSRVVLHKGSSQAPSEVAKLGIPEGSLDLIIEDGEHKPRAVERSLIALWPLLKPGGVYCAEDLSTGAWPNSGQYHSIHRQYSANPETRGFHPLIHNATWRRAESHAIFEAHDSFFANTAVGHRDYAQFYLMMRGRFGGHVARAPPAGRDDLINHISHVMVLRKRHIPRTETTTPLAIHTGRRSMKLENAKNRAVKQRRSRDRGLNFLKVATEH